MKAEGLVDGSGTRVEVELRRLAAVYADPRVLGIRVRTSRRLTASLARAHLARAEVVLAEALLGSRHLEEVVTHEVAHVVCWWRHGRVRPHGTAWRALVSQAGHVPSVRMDPRDVTLPARRRRVRRRRHPATVSATLHAFVRSLL
jgi:predicted SprT family Zn-dependent metalloprotease